MNSENYKKPHTLEVSGEQMYLLADALKIAVRSYRQIGLENTALNMEELNKYITNYIKYLK